MRVRGPRLRKDERPTAGEGFRHHAQGHPLASVGARGDPVLDALKGEGQRVALVLERNTVPVDRAGVVFDEPLVAPEEPARRVIGDVAELPFGSRVHPCAAAGADAARAIISPIANLRIAAPVIHDVVHVLQSGRDLQHEVRLPGAEDVGGILYVSRSLLGVRSVRGPLLKRRGRSLTNLFGAAPTGHVVSMTCSKVRHERCTVAWSRAGRTPCGSFTTRCMCRRAASTRIRAVETSGIARGTSRGWRRSAWR